MRKQKIQLQINYENHYYKSNGAGRKEITTVTLFLGVVGAYELANIDDFSERLLKIIELQSANGSLKKIQLQGSGFAEIMARIALQLQNDCGIHQSYWRVEKGLDSIYEVSFGCEDEAIGEYVANAAFRIIRSALYRQRYSADSDIRMVKNLSARLAVAS